MGEFHIYQLTASPRGAIVALAVNEETVQTWDAATGEKLSEVHAPYAYGGFRLALNPAGSLCAAASYYKGRRGGVACHDVRSGETLWHRTDVGLTHYLRFASDSGSLWCGRQEGPLLRLDNASGETLEEVRNTMDVHESPRSAHALVVPRSSAYLLRGADTFRFPRRSFLSSGNRKRTHYPTAVEFGPEAVWLAETGDVLRCFDYTGTERRQVEAPTPALVCQLCYRPADRSFYGVEWDRQSGGWCNLMRYSDTGAGTKVCEIKARWGDLGFCLNGDLVVTATGDVIETARGTTVRTIRFQ